MSKIVKVLLLCTYIVLITQYIKSLIMSKTHEEILEMEYLLIKPQLMKKIEKEAKKMNIKNVTIITNVPERLPTDLKFILQFTNAIGHKSSYTKIGQDEFIKAKCKYVNCFLTSDKNLLFGVHYFDAILFDVENHWDGYPLVRSPYQKYIFVSSDPAIANPICNKFFDDFYNLTWTYKLDSDITWSYITIFDKNGTVVGPKIDMNWQKPMDPIPEKVRKKLAKKNKVAAWFVSNCNTKNQRGIMFEHLKLEFLKYNMSIDVFGWCGQKKCEKHRMEDCLHLVEKEYYFYLAFESSVCEDYVTEKVLNALLHYSVPIVFGGANYTRFLPPGSYINAEEETPENVVALVIEAMQNRKIYEDYFRWHNHYVYKNTEAIGDVCTLCDIMNRPLAHRTVKNFRKWWNPNYKTMTEDCHRHY